MSLVRITGLRVRETLSLAAAQVAALRETDQHPSLPICLGFKSSSGAVGVKPYGHLVTSEMDG